MTPSFEKFWKRTPSGEITWTRAIDEDGIRIRRVQERVEPSLSASVQGFVTQLLDEGLLIERGDSEWLLDWPSLFAAEQSGLYNQLPSALALPEITATRPQLRSRNSLTDSTFEIAVSGWLLPSGRVSNPKYVGGLLDFGGSLERMTREQWELVRSVRDFAVRGAEGRDEATQRRGWANIRVKARAAGANLDDFLERSLVLAPSRLQIELRRSEDVEGVVEILPTFEGAPADWMAHFDRRSEVPTRYDIPTSSGIVQVLIEAQVKTVLEEIKRFPARRVAGRRAEAFIANPFAALGEDASRVIDETQFESAKEDAGLLYERFSPIVRRQNSDHSIVIGLLIERANQSGLFDSSEQLLSDEELKRFINLAENSVSKSLQFIAWDGFDLEVQGDTIENIQILRAALAERQNAHILISYDDVYDLSNYSSRVEGIGTEKPYYSPYIAKKKDDDGWFPENIQPVIARKEGDEIVSVIEADEGVKSEIREALKNAKTTGATEIRTSSIPESMTVDEATNILETFEKVEEEIGSESFDPRKGPTKAKKSKRLILKRNIETVDYEETRAAALSATPEATDIPSSLSPDVKLLPHQEVGIAWMQHLFRLRNEHMARGAVLADDMGLGKTLQLLVFMASILERAPDTAPMLVVAPVALLENWEEEVRKFFQPGTLPVLTAYGANLSALRIPKEQVAERLRAEDGLDKFLRPNWVGNARIVLTTYETLRDYEFGFAKQRWSVMICDEAQRIKNPAAMVTRAAKKQHVQFKIACTGTPVENALVDLWCLFDFIQPGLLGALNEFGQKYSKPIEAKTDEERARVEELRERIAPQILRRTKAEVAKDLPAKRIVQSCRSLPLSTHQRALYAKALDDFKNRNTPGAVTPFKNHLGLLQYLRAICTDPQRYGQTVFKAEAADVYRSRAPKMDWLLRELATIKAKQEKVIIFCEFREIQRLLQHYIREAFGFQPDIVNGDTSAATASELSRQKRIKAFQSRPGFGVIVLSPLAVGFGVNIQAANHVIHYTRTWNPAKEDQATDRAYRIGQKKEVFVYYPTVTAPDFTTFEAKLDTLLTRKRELAADMLNGSGDVTFGEFVENASGPAAAMSGLDERIVLDAAHRMNGRYFESLVAAIWASLGYQCHLTPQSGDKGIDVIALKGPEGVLLQVKTSGSESARLNWEAVKDVVTGAAFYQRQYAGVKFSRACFTNRYFNAGAHEQAELNDVRLYDEGHLKELLETHMIMESEVERWMHAN